MVTMGNNIFLPTPSLMNASPMGTANSMPLQGSTPQTNIINQFNQQNILAQPQSGLGNMKGSATLNQMALMSNNLALTGSLFTQFSSVLQTMMQGLSSGTCDSGTPQYANPCPQPQTPASAPQPPVYSTPQPQMPVYTPPQQQTPVCPPPSAYMPPLPTYTMPQMPVYTPQPPVCNTPKPQAPVYNSGNGGRYWGDPHLEGFDGEKYDVMGKGGNIYNMLSDKNVQYNTTFANWGKPGKDGVQPTVIGEAGIQVGENLVYFDRSGEAPTVNGKSLSKGQTVDLGDGQHASWDGEKLTVKTTEYTINLDVKEKGKDGGYLNSSVSVNKGVNPLADGVAAHGLLGQTADGVKGERKGGDGNKNIEKQGGSVIDGVVDDYRVKNLWDNDFKYNRFAPEGQDMLSQLFDLLHGLAKDLAA